MGDSSSKAVVYIPKLRYFNSKLSALQKNIASTCASKNPIVYELKYNASFSIWNYQYLFSAAGAEKLQQINSVIANVDENLASESTNYFSNTLLPISDNNSNSNIDIGISLPLYSRKSGRWIPTGDFTQ